MDLCPEAHPKASGVAYVTSATLCVSIGSTLDDSAIRRRSRSPSPISISKFTPLTDTDSVLPHQDAALPLSRATTAGPAVNGVSFTAVPDATAEPITNAAPFTAVPASAAIPAHNVAVPGTHPNRITRPVHERFTPTSPQAVLDRRYAERHRLDLAHSRINSIENIPAMEFSFSHDPSNDHPWIRMEHPEGQLYFKRSVVNDIPVYTDIQLEEEEKLHIVEQFACELSQEVKKRLEGLPSDVEIVLDVRWETPPEVQCHYYLASRGKRAIIWLEEAPVKLITLHLRPVVHVSQLKCNPGSVLVWCSTMIHRMVVDHHDCRLHIGLFPDDRKVSADILDEVNELLNFNAFDAKTSETSTSPFGHEDLVKLADCIRNLKGGGGAPAIWIIARTMYILYWERFLHFHGQREARLDRHESIFHEFSKPREHCWFFRFVSPFLFNVPNYYAEQLNKIWVDQTVNHVPWRKFVASLQRDWQNSITPAAVLLTANVGLLAVNTVDTNGPRNVAEITSYISTFLSLGNIILCSILVRQHDAIGLANAEGASEYLYRRTTMLAGLDLIAIMFSLPYALFLWGMGTFYIAVAWVCFDRSGLWTRLITGIIFALVTLLTAAVVSVEMWPGDESPSLWQNMFSRIRHVMTASFPKFGPKLTLTKTWGQWFFRRGPEGGQGDSNV